MPGIKCSGSLTPLVAVEQLTPQQTAAAGPIYAVPASGVVVVHGDASGGSIGTSQAENPIQEAFKHMMLNFMGSMQTDFQLTPDRTLGVIIAAGGGTMGNTGMQREGLAGSALSVLICYNCQKPRDTTSQCKSSSTRNADNRGPRESTGNNGMPGVKTVGNGELTNNAKSSHGTASNAVVTEIGHVTEVAGEQLTPVTCVKVVAVAAVNHIVAAACSTLMRLPAVAAILEKAMVDEHIRVEYGNYEQPTRGPK